MSAPQNWCKTTGNMEDTEVIYGMSTKLTIIFLLLTHFRATYVFFYQYMYQGRTLLNYTQDISKN